MTVLHETKTQKHTKETKPRILQHNTAY